MSDPIGYAVVHHLRGEWAEWTVDTLALYDDEAEAKARADVVDGQVVAVYLHPLGN